MEEQITENIKPYNSDRFFRINRIKRYTNDKIESKLVTLNTRTSEDYHMYFVSHGPLKIKNSKATFIMNNFDLLIYKVSGRQEISSSYMSSYVHCIFSGKCVAEILDELKFKTDKVYKITPCRKSGEQFYYYNRQIEYVLAEFRKQKMYSQLSSSCMLVEFLSLYSRNRDEDSQTPADPNFQEIEKAISYILENVEKPLDADTLISTTRLSRKKFYKLFKEYTGTSPLHFQLSWRLAAASDYLIIYNMKIKEVSKRLGFNDPLYFGRIFKKEFGMSPRQYVAEHKIHTPLHSDNT